MACLRLVYTFVYIYIYIYIYIYTYICVDLCASMSVRWYAVGCMTVGAFYVARWVWCFVLLEMYAYICIYMCMCTRAEHLSMRVYISVRNMTTNRGQMLNGWKTIVNGKRRVWAGSHTNSTSSAARIANDTVNTSGVCPHPGYVLNSLTNEIVKKFKNESNTVAGVNETLCD